MEVNRKLKFQFQDKLILPEFQTRRIIRPLEKLFSKFTPHTHFNKVTAIQFTKKTTNVNP